MNCSAYEYQVGVCLPQSRVSFLSLCLVSNRPHNTTQIQKKIGGHTHIAPTTPTKLAAAANKLYTENQYMAEEGVVEDVGICSTIKRKIRPCVVSVRRDSIIAMALGG